MTDEENIEIWYEVLHQQELEHEADLQAWFEVMMEREREQDEAFREEMYEIMDCVFEQPQLKLFDNAILQGAEAGY